MSGREGWNFFYFLSKDDLVWINVFPQNSKLGLILINIKGANVIIICYEEIPKCKPYCWSTSLKLAQQIVKSITHCLIELS